MKYEHIDQKSRMLMILNALPDIGPMTFRRLMDRFDGKLGELFSANYDTLSSIGGVSRNAAERLVHWQRYFNLEKEEENLRKISSQFLGYGETLYPSILREIYDAPIGLYQRGSVDLNKTKNIAIIGTRKASIYGLKIASEFARELAMVGYNVVSGMAIGIDAAAHEGALSVSGSTTAVLGCGIDVIYPRENKNLYHKIAEKGTIISEFALGRIADKQTFPIRNRIIAGLCSHVIVVESALSGGSIITANIANEYGKTVFAVPGRIDQFSSQGCHALIRDGATLVSEIDHILEELQASRQLNINFEEEKEMTLDDPVDRKILECLKRDGAQLIDDIADITEMPIPCLISKLQLLELRQIVKKSSDGYYDCH